ncbi:hypothetical protein AVEN_220677-1 [Araneus ventricosus]|uniref:Uncharacterized protein n=1 Tax=Araneus ventricosus TaxID=182803 RepID=A0A4Y2RKP3_ARAVE|nr:hypothetical protein AVEN_153364-1 [Araneus ventricosus]GBN76344.1 hypothetical protein AVEN_220677-1 [Araneus ventricosus]
MVQKSGEGVPTQVSPSVTNFQIKVSSFVLYSKCAVDTSIEPWCTSQIKDWRRVHNFYCLEFALLELLPSGRSHLEYEDEKLPQNKQVLCTPGTLIVGRLVNGPIVVDGTYCPITRRKTTTFKICFIYICRFNKITTVLPPREKPHKLDMPVAVVIETVYSTAF